MMLVFSVYFSNIPVLSVLLLLVLFLVLSYILFLAVIIPGFWNRQGWRKRFVQSDGSWESAPVVARIQVNFVYELITILLQPDALCGYYEYYPSGQFRLTNWSGILGQGLRIAPPEAPVTGYMFGKVSTWRLFWRVAPFHCIYLRLSCSLFGVGLPRW